jgi:hypothetical protein
MCKTECEGALYAQPHRRFLVAAFRVEQCGQQDMPEPIDVDLVEIVIGEIEFESPAEVLDLLLEFTASQHRNGCRNLLETSV